MKHQVIAEVDAVERKIEHALHGRAYSVLGMIFCVGILLAAALSRPKSVT